MPEFVRRHGLGDGTLWHRRLSSVKHWMRGLLRRNAMDDDRTLPLDTIICGDNVAVMATFPAACIDLVVTSPPYDNLRTYGGHSWDFEGVAQQLWRVIKPGGVVVWVVADATIDGSETGTSFRQALRFMEIGFRLHDTMIYQRYSAPLTHNRYEQEFEFCFILSNGKPTRWNPIKRQRIWSDKRTDKMFRREKDGSRDRGFASQSDEVLVGNIWNYEVASTGQDGIAHQHPAIFPEALARDHILSWSNEGDIVLDPFGGSGTTAKMARLMGRRFIHIDVNEEYCEIARNRIAQKLLEF